MKRLKDEQIYKNGWLSEYVSKGIICAASHILWSRYWILTYKNAFPILTPARKKFLSINYVNTDNVLRGLVELCIKEH